MHILIKLTNEFDYAKVRRNPVFDFSDHHRMRVLKWDANFSFEKESSVVPVWISFPELPNNLYEKKALMLLAKSVGTPLQMDEPTSNRSRTSRPRVCFEFDCRRPTPEKIYIHLRDDISGLNEEGFWQKVIFEKLPSYCSHCNTLGHDMVSCKLQGEVILQQLEKQTENQATNESAPYLTDNWEIGNRRRGKGGAALRERNFFQGETSTIITKNTFSSLEKEQRDAEKQNFPQVCDTNREASVPGSSTFEEGECVRLNSGKNQVVISKKESILEGGDRSLKIPPQMKVSKPESGIKRGNANLEDIVTIEDVSEEEEADDLQPEIGIPFEDLPERDGRSGGHNQTGGMLNQALLLSEKGGIRGDVSEVGVAQETCTDAAEELSSGKERRRVVDTAAPGGAVGSLGPVNYEKELVGQRSAHFAVPKATVQSVVDPVAKAQKQEGFGSSSRQSGSESDLVENWLFCDRIKSMAERRGINKDAEAFPPPLDGGHPAQIIEIAAPNNQAGGDSSSNIVKEKPSALNKDAMAITPSLGIKQDRPSPWDAEDNFLLQQLESSPPVTRSRALKLARKKKKGERIVRVPFWLGMNFASACVGLINQVLEKKVSEVCLGGVVDDVALVAYLNFRAGSMNS